MNRKTIGSLVISLFAASQIVVGIPLPSEYRNWPVKAPSFHLFGTMTYRPNEMFNSEVVGEYEFNVTLDDQGKDPIPITVIAYSRKPNLNPKQNLLDIKVKIRDKNPEHEKLLKEIEWKMGSYCKRCHNIPDILYSNNSFNIPKFVNTAL